MVSIGTFRAASREQNVCPQDVDPATPAEICSTFGDVERPPEPPLVDRRSVFVDQHAVAP